MVAASAGRRGSRWRTLHANLKAQCLPCWLCGQPIDYTLDKSDPMSFEADHAHPISTHPHLAMDPANLRASHARCNRTRGVRQPLPDIGAPSIR